jgi:hypothetical protein
MTAIYTLDQAALVAEGLTATDLDHWTYSVVTLDSGMARIGVADEFGEWVGYLGIHLVADHQADILRLTGSGYSITVG